LAIEAVAKQDGSSCARFERPPSVDFTVDFTEDI
jgi:hypothetical protein